MIKCKICKTPLSSNYIRKNSMTIKNVSESTFNISDNLVNLNIFECHYCGAVQLFDVPISEDYDVVYRSLSVSLEYRKQKKQQLKNIIDDYSLIDKKVIEVGCGDGQFLELFKELGLDCHGSEQGSVNHKKCNDKGFSDIVDNIFEYHMIDSYRYDAFFTFHYLEHLPNPINFVHNLWRILKQDGIGVIEVPNYDFIEKNNIWVEFVKDHRVYYRKRTLSYLFLKCGFEILEIQENNEEICLMMVVKKPKEVNFNLMENSIEEDIQKFKDLIKSLTGDFVVYGAGHHSQLLLSNVYDKFKIKPKRIFDSNKDKCGGKICGIVVEHKDNITNIKDCENIIIGCGIYSEEVKEMLVDMNLGKNLIVWE